MNQKTSKVLRRFAAHEGRNPKEIKRQWLKMPHAQRAGERARMKSEISAR